MKRLLLVTGLVILAIAGWAMPAFAHAVLESTDPPGGAVLQKSPGAVVLHFGEDVEIQLGAVRVVNSAGGRVDSGSAYHPYGDSHAVATNVPASLAGGGYVVSWRVISADSHPVHGAFTFQIGAGAAAAAASTAEATKLLAAGGGSRTVGVLFGIIRFLAFGALFVLVGGTTFVAGAWRTGAEDKRVRRLLWGALVAAVVTTGLAICIQGPYGGALPLSQLVKPSVVSAVAHTRFGEVYLVRLSLLLTATPLLLGIVLGRRALPRWWPSAAGLTGVALLVTPGLAGHAGTGMLIALAIPFDLVHMAAVAVWFGGLAVVVVALLAGRTTRVDRSEREVLTRYAQWALWAVCAIAISGGFAAWRQIGSFSAVTTTTFGRLVLAKTILFVVAVLVASFSRRMTFGNLAVPFGLSARFERARATPTAGLSAPSPSSPGPGAVAATKPRPGRGGAASGRLGRRRRGPRRPFKTRLRGAVAAEVVLAVGIIAVASILVNTQPARSSLALPYSTEVHAGANVLVDVIVDPAKAGPVEIHLYTLSPDGAQLDVPEVTATFSLASAGINDLKVPLEKAGPGHFLTSGFDVPLQGAWKLNVTVRTTNTDEFYANPITVHMH